MSIQPLQDNLLVKPVAEEEITAGGIVLPDTVTKEKPQKGEVIAVGPGRVGDDGKRIPIDPKLKPGVTVIFKKYSTTEIKDKEEELYIIDESGVLAIIE